MLACEYGDTDLEAMALAFGGLARVTLGQVDEGMGQLDEAMAMATAGEISSFMTSSEVFCVLLSACGLYSPGGEPKARRNTIHSAGVLCRLSHR